MPLGLCLARQNFVLKVDNLYHISSYDQNVPIL